MAETDVAATGIVAGSPENPKPAANENPQGASDWAKGLDEGLRKRVEKFKTPDDLARSYVELETYASKSFQDMTPQERERYIKRLGLPEKPEEYELSDLTLPEELKRTKEGDAEFRAIMHSLKLTKEQAKGLHEWAMKRASGGWSAQREVLKRQADEQSSSLRTAWGASHDANQAAVDKVIRLGGEKFVERMNNGPGKDAVIREGLLAISKQFADETLVSGRVEKRKTETRPGMVVDFSKSPELQGT